MKKITATVPAWITHGCTTQAELLSATPERAVSAVTAYLPHGDKAPDGWVQVGTAQIILTLIDPEKYVEGQIAVLKEAKTKLQAETQIKLNAIDEHIGRLLCLEHKPAIDQ